VTLRLCLINFVTAFTILCGLPALGADDTNRTNTQGKFYPPETSCISQIDYTQAPDAAGLCDGLVNACDQNYPIILRSFDLQADSGRPKIEIILTNDKQVPLGLTKGNVLILNANFLTLHPDEMGMVIYQLACAYERFRVPAAGFSCPLWLRAGLADYIRLNAVGMPASKWSAECRPGDSFLTSSRCGAAFLAYLERNYNKVRPVASAYKVLVAGTYNDDFWKQLTGSSLDQLFADFAPPARTSQGGLIYRPNGESCVSFVDYTQFPALGPLCPQFVHALDANYAWTRSLLLTPPAWHPEKIDITFSAVVPGRSALGASFVAVTAGNHILFNGSIAEKDIPNACGALVHEMTHVFQQYPRPLSGYSAGPLWLTEGLADYVRARARDITDRPSWCAACGRGQTYKVGYTCAAALLLYIERTYADSKPVENINLALLDGSYNEGLWSALTGKDIDSLWNDFAPHAGERPILPK